MTSTNRSEILRRIITSRNLLIVFCLFLVVSTVTAECDDISSTKSGTENTGYSGIDGVWFSIANKTVLSDFYSYSFFTNSSFFDMAAGEYDVYLGYGYAYDYDPTECGEGTVTITDVDGGQTFELIVTDWDISGAPAGALYIDIYRTDYGSMYDGGASRGGITYTPAYFYPCGSNFGYCGATCARHQSYFLTYNLEICYTQDPVYDIDLTGTGTFCYGHSLSFNLSSNPSGFDALYSLKFYKSGSDHYPTTDYIEQDAGTGPLLYTKTLEPGDWAVHGEISGYVGETLTELEEWLNFTIVQDCSQAFNGTISSTYNPFNVTSFNTNWDPYYDWIANMSLSDDTSFFGGFALLEYLNSSGVIDPADYNNFYNITQYYSDQYNLSALNSTSQLEDYTFGILTPLYMINDSISSVRSNLNTSYSVLTDSISPITTIFTYIFQIIPSFVINLISCILAFDAVRIVLAGRKN